MLDKYNHKSKYFIELNSLRFIGFLGIFFGHVFFSNNLEIVKSPIYTVFHDYGKILGFISLDSFFVLSSFLITWKALEELQFSNGFSFKNFLIRRTLRIWPLYFLVVFLGYFIFYTETYFNHQINPLPSFWSFVFFILNFDIIENGYEFLFFMVFLWSISVEEQFYIFWAIILKWFNNHLTKISMGLILISLIFRFYYLNSPLNLNFNTLSTLGNFGVGSLVAISAFKKDKTFLFIQQLSKNKVIFLYASMLLIFLISPVLWKINFFVIIQRLVYSILFAFIILEQSYCKNSIIKFSSIQFFDFFGKISFGLYCYHGLIIAIILKLDLNQSLLFNIIIYPILILISTIFISYISYQYYELKFLKLKTRYTLSN